MKVSLGLKAKNFYDSIKNTLVLLPLGNLENMRTYGLYTWNTETHLSIDEVALSQDELFIIVTNKKAKDKTKSLVAIIASTKAEQVIEHVCKIEFKKRQAVIKITLDMAHSMN